MNEQRDTITISHGAAGSRVDGEMILEAFHTPWHMDGIQLAYVIKKYDGLYSSYYGLTGLTFEKVEDVVDAQYPDPLITLSMGHAQGLMDSLWRCGVRPVDGQYTKGQQEATENHLSDMKTLTFRLIDNVLTRKE